MPEMFQSPRGPNSARNCFSRASATCFLSQYRNHLSKSLAPFVFVVADDAMSSAVPAAAPDVRTYWRRLYWCIDRGGDDFAVLKSRPDLRSWCTFASEISDFGGVLPGEGAKA